MRTIKTYSKRAPFYNAFIGTDSHNLLERRRGRGSGIRYYNDLTDMRGLPNTAQVI
jgi:hypothetical protein